MSIKNSNLIDDSGLHDNLKAKQATVFIGACHIMTLILIILGLFAMYKGYF